MSPSEAKTQIIFLKLPNFNIIIVTELVGRDCRESMVSFPKKQWVRKSLPGVIIAPVSWVDVLTFLVEIANNESGHRWT